MIINSATIYEKCLPKMFCSSMAAVQKKDRQIYWNL